MFEICVLYFKRKLQKVNFYLLYDSFVYSLNIYLQSIKSVRNQHQFRRKLLEKYKVSDTWGQEVFNSFHRRNFAHFRAAQMTMAGIISEFIPSAMTGP